MDIGTMNGISALLGIHPLWIALALIWTLVWKGLALWRASTLRQKYWFIAMLVINTLGILEIIYLFLVAKKYKIEIVEEK
jgi:methionyl-tRNA synthetase